MKRVINLDNWNRKEHFKFFSALDDPFWGITTTVDFTSVYQQSKNMEVSFFLYSVYIHQCPPWLGGWTKCCRIYTELKRRTKQYIMI